MLSFFTKLAGPVFAKEMVEIARRKRYYFNRVFLGLVLLFTLFMVYQSHRWRLTGMSGESITAMALLAESMFMAASTVQYAAVYLFVPLFVCGVIASEREEKTLELLFTTDLSDREIVLGKLFSRLAAVLGLIVCAMPIMSLITLLGGIDPRWVWRVLAATLLATLVAGAHGIYFSAITKSPMGAVVRTYFWLAMIYLGVPLGGMLIVGAYVEATKNFSVLETYMSVIAFIHPLGSFVPALEGTLYDRLALRVHRWFFVGTFVGPLLWSLFLIWRAIRRLRLPPSLFGTFLRRLPGLMHFLEWRHQRGERRTRGRSLERAERWWFAIPIQNPLWLRARLARVYDREGHIGRLQWAGWGIAFAFLILTAIASDGRAMDEEEVSMTFQAGAWIALAALTVIIAGMSVTADRRRGFFELVLVTPLTGREIVDGTILAVWHHLRRLYWMLLPLALLFVLTGASLFFGTVASLITGTLFLALMILYGVGCSLAARSMPAALVPTLAFPIVVNVMLGFCIGIFEEAHGPLFWAFTMLFLAGSYIWIRRRMSAAAVGCFLIAVHLGICGLFSCWLWDANRNELPIAAMHPGFLTIAVLDNRPAWGAWGAFRNWGRIGSVLALPCYWTALILNIVWARWWLIRHFDRLVERTRQGPQPVERLEEVRA